MSIWGKVAGAAAGLAAGGPLGALLGVVAGHYVIDRPLQDNEVVFAVALIALSAKMAKADGIVSPSEIRAFEEVFKVPPEERANVARVYKIAQQDVAGFEAYAKQVASIYKANPGVLEDVMDALFHIAKADNKVLQSEIDFLYAVADIFGFSDFEFERIKLSHIGGESDDPYMILGITPDISDEDLKKAYRRLARENHPDTLVARGVPQEFVDMAEEKLKKITEAYSRIAKSRGL